MVRTADVINESLLRAHLWAVDRNLTKTYIEGVVESVNDFLRRLVALGAILSGRGYAGKVAEFTLPKLTVKTEEYRAGGMDAPVELDMGMEKLECDFSLDSVDRGALRLWGLAEGSKPPLTFRGAVQDKDGTVRAVIVRTRGQIKEVDWGSWKPGEKATLKFMAAVDYYRLEIDGETIHEIDIENMVRTVNGTDQVAARRAALGL